MAKTERWRFCSLPQILRPLNKTSPRCDVSEDIVGVSSPSRLHPRSGQTCTEGQVSGAGQEKHLKLLLKSPLAEQRGEFVCVPASIIDVISGEQLAICCVTQDLLTADADKGHLQLRATTL